MFKGLTLACATTVVLGCATVPPNLDPAENADTKDKYEKLKTLQDYCSASQSISNRLSPCLSYEYTAQFQKNLLSAINEADENEAILDMSMLAGSLVAAAAATFGAHEDLLKASGLTIAGLASIKQYNNPAELKIALKNTASMMQCILTTRTLVLPREPTITTFHEYRDALGKRHSDLSKIDWSSVVAPAGHEQRLEQLRSATESIISNHDSVLDLLKKYEMGVDGIGLNILDATNAAYIALYEARINSRPDIRAVMQTLQTRVAELNAESAVTEPVESAATIAKQNENNVPMAKGAEQNTINFNAQMKTAIKLITEYRTTLRNARDYGSNYATASDTMKLCTTSS
ncbi:hypothetical protein IC617_08740 [Neiella sp. HB171785]|uniref:Lipoprotein n=1 Tax=Neiella litorisoli TaxID=2771431 RepID=A0A8J6QIS0_9GAMM|nr:hypothetical protein [Neiella litorisoli]MBD1389513.1 hypothetical protein [Neiella litorisoli]